MRAGDYQKMWTHGRTGFDHGRRGLYNKRDYIVLNAKLEAKGWRPHHGLDAGIRELIKGQSNVA
jgi:hypothetical protein